MPPSTGVVNIATRSLWEKVGKIEDGQAEGMTSESNYALFDSARNGAEVENGAGQPGELPCTTQGKRPRPEEWPMTPG